MKLRVVFHTGKTHPFQDDTWRPTRSLPLFRKQQNLQKRKGAEPTGKEHLFTNTHNFYIDVNF